jgi:thioester reductase-like protein
VAVFEGTSHPLITESIRVLADALEEAKLEIPSAKFARLVAEIYERAAGVGHVDAEYVRRLVALLK